MGEIATTGEATPTVRPRGDLMALAERLWIKAHGGDPKGGMPEAIRDQADRIRADFAGPNPSMIERMIVDKIVLCYLDSASWELAVANATLAGTASREHEKRRERADRRYLAALRTLAQVRRLRLLEMTFVGRNLVVVQGIAWRFWLLRADVFG